MDQIEPEISLAEFQTIWFKCTSAMNTLVMEKGYGALTLSNISRRTQLSEQKLLTCFLSIENLLQMYDGVIILEQALKLKFGNERIE